MNLAMYRVLVLLWSNSFEIFKTDFYGRKVRYLSSLTCVVLMTHPSIMGSFLHVIKCNSGASDKCDKNGDMGIKPMTQSNEIGIPLQYINPNKEYFAKLLVYTVSQA